MKKTIISSMMLLTISMSLSLGLAQQPASALVSDPTTIDRLQDERNDLLIQESRQLRDQDDLNRQIDTLKRVNDPRNRFLLNDLSQKRDIKFNQLQQTRYDLREIEQALM
ncbi:MAG TPA: hypothetical protein V6C81_19260 [Planktothrix sp.]|jgi:hypothetical protein